MTQRAMAYGIQSGASGATGNGLATRPVPPTPSQQQQQQQQQQPSSQQIQPQSHGLPSSPYLHPQRQQLHQAQQQQQQQQQQQIPLQHPPHLPFQVHQSTITQRTQQTQPHPSQPPSSQPLRSISSSNDNSMNSKPMMPLGYSTSGTPTSSMSMRMSDYDYEGSDQLLSKLKIQQLLGQIDPKERLEPEVENILLEIADEFIESVGSFACLLAKHRKSDTLEVKDLQIHLGFASDEIRSARKPTTATAHQNKIAAINSHKATKAQATQLTGQSGNPTNAQGPNNVTTNVTANQGPNQSGDTSNGANPNVVSSGNGGVSAGRSGAGVE
ncbi:3022_t:CDS:2 [Paraglomus brasilianum]|uniref:TBP-associated factor 12 n=1 Tax=Paraglomus brasilianum TaxID=144538 RepID=A0A9N9BER7_9GLOM|nr:3022_t:CDS:2 [Paraglomus brasilianum]